MFKKRKRSQTQPTLPPLRDLQTLDAVIKGDDAAARLEALKELNSAVFRKNWSGSREDIRETTGLLDVLLSLMKDPDVETRRAAIQAVRQSWENSPSEVIRKAFLIAATDADLIVRRFASSCLHLYPDQEVVSALGMLAKEEDSSCALGAVAALSKLGDLGREHLLEATKHPVSEVQESAMSALAPKEPAPTAADMAAAAAGSESEGFLRELGLEIGLGRKLATRKNVRVLAKELGWPAVSLHTEFKVFLGVSGNVSYSRDVSASQSIPGGQSAWEEWIQNPVPSFTPELYAEALRFGGTPHADAGSFLKSAIITLTRLKKSQST